MIDNVFTYFIGKYLMSPLLHHWFSARSKWMFAAVWIRKEQRHRWMWVDRNRYYDGEFQSV